MNHRCVGISRRRFLRSGLQAGGAAFGIPYIVPSHVLGLGRAVAPNEKIVMGCIGIGSMGGGHLRSYLGYEDIRMVGVCDLRAKFRERAKNWVDQRYGDQACVMYQDFRELLARPDIDAVFVATPEHWHGLVGIEAARQGKAMYLEKPIDVHVGAAQALRRAVQRYRVVFQFGTQQRSDPRFHRACELVRNGRIGKLQTIVVGSLPAIEYPNQALEPEPDPKEFDYDMWLGPAPWAPYTFQRCASRAEGSVGVWMHIHDYGLGGLAGAWGIHHVDIAQWGNGTDHTGPLEIQGSGRIPRDGLADTPTAWHVTHRYANGVRMIHANHRRAAQDYVEFNSPQLNQPGCGILFLGSEGWVVVCRGGIDAGPKSLLDSVIRSQEVHLPLSLDHRRNFLNCVRTQAQTICPIETAVRSDTICHLDDIAIRLERPLKWDPDRERFINDEQANRMLERPLRSPWQL